MSLTTTVRAALSIVAMTWWLVAAASSDAAFATAQGFIGSALGLLLLFGWSVALFFHLYSGVRHLIWDAGVAGSPSKGGCWPKRM